MSKGMPYSKIGYRGIGADGRMIERYYGWNPFGFGCSYCSDTGVCLGTGARCWARQLAKRMQCEKCRAFVPHLHQERLEQPLHTRKPGVVLVQFMGDFYDPAHVIRDRHHVIDAIRYVDRHIYVFLTQQPELVTEWWFESLSPPDNWHLGLTVCNQADFDAKWPAFSGIDGNLWISYEPAQGPVDWKPAVRHPGVKGIIIGHDRNKGAAGTHTDSHLQKAATAFRRAHKTAYLKQRWSLILDKRPAVLLKGEGELPGDRLPWSLPPEAKQ